MEGVIFFAGVFICAFQLILCYRTDNNKIKYIPLQIILLGVFSVIVFYSTGIGTYNMATIKEGKSFFYLIMLLIAGILDVIVWILYKIRERFYEI